MAEDTARAVGAGDSGTITIDGKVCQIRPLSLIEMCELERACLDDYRLNRLRFLKESAEFLPEGEGLVNIREAQSEMSTWDVTNLPPKFVHRAETVDVNPDIRNWLTEEWDIDLKGYNDDQIKKMIATALDMGQMTPKKYEELVGEPPKQLNAGYANWWITGCKAGMMETVWKCFAPGGITKEQVIRYIGTDLAKLVQISRAIEYLSTPDVGNG